MGSTALRRVAIALAIVACATAAVAAEGEVGAPTRVEFVRAPRRQCLQPVKHVSDPVLTDYEDAENRWIDARYSGIVHRRLERTLRIRPETTVGPDADLIEVRRDTFDLGLSDGSTVTLCFEINLRTHRPQRPEEARPVSE